VSEHSIHALPKILLHDHLDGGVRKSTLSELGAPHAPKTGAHQGLRGYLRYFEPVLSVLQTADNLERVAHEAGEDLLEENVIYAEIRFAPRLHTRNGLTPEEAIAAVGRGLRASGLHHGLIVSAMRTDDPADTIAAAEAAVRSTGHGVIGFDLAGLETGNRAGRHLKAIEAAAKGGLGVTLHAGEADGPEAVIDAIDAGATRIGHGVRAVESERACQRLANERITLEVCPSSNLDTGIYATMDEHPAERLRRAGIAVTVNTDNRSASSTTLTRELTRCVDTFGWTVQTLMELQRNAAQSAFLSGPDKEGLLRRLGTHLPEGVVNPGS